MIYKLRPLLAVCLLTGSAFVVADSSLNGATSAGVLDTPLPNTNTALTLSSPQPSLIVNSGRPEDVQTALREELSKEQEVLEQLPRPELEELAEQGERAAQVTLAEDFAKEAALLSFAPEAANDALSDAVRWYSLAAKRGFPGAPSLDQAGVQFYPIRVQRSQ